MKKISLLFLAIGMGLVLFAQGPGKQNTDINGHPRVNQVNQRIDNQEKRINNERKDGDISKQQAKQDRKNLKAINQEKKDMRRTDGGHITKKDQKALNQQLNQNSNNIKK
jgi:hypothetical protein